MYLRAPARPRYWKALLASALFVVPLTLLLRLAFAMNGAAWMAVAAILTLTIATLVHLSLRSKWLGEQAPPAKRH